MTDQPWTIKRLLEWTAPYLTEKGSHSGRLDAEVLLANVLACQRIDLYARFDEVPNPDQLAKFRGYVKNRAEGQPVAYLVGYREFFSLEFKVNDAVLIPRPETELLVIQSLDFIKEHAKPTQLHVLDIGTGSGCIPIALAKHSTRCHLTAVDISPEAIEIAKQNAETHQVDSRIEFIESDLFAAVESDKKFDLIVSNPPYIGTSEEGTVDESVRNFEPHVALFSGEKGLDAIEKIISESPDFLNEGGRLMFELSPIIAKDCKQLLNANERLTDAQILNDFSNQPRVAIATLK